MGPAADRHPHARDPSVFGLFDVTRIQTLDGSQVVGVTSRRRAVGDVGDTRGWRDRSVVRWLLDRRRSTADRRQRSLPSVRDSDDEPLSITVPADEPTTRDEDTVAVPSRRDDVEEESIQS